MRILVVSHFIPYPPHGGSFQRNYNLLKEACRNNSVDFLALVPRLFHPTEKELNNAVEALGELCSSVRVFRIPTDYSRLGWYSLLFGNSFSLTPYSVWRFHSREMLEAIHEQLSKGNYDLVQIDTIALAPYAQLCPGIPNILVHQNVESTLMLRRAQNERNPVTRLYLYLQGRKLRRYETQMLKRFDAHVMVSELDKAELGQLADGARIEVVPNGTDTEYFQPIGPVSSRELTFTGGMTWYPNKDAMIFFCREVYPIIKEQVPDVTMNVVGMAPPDEVVQMAQADSSIRTSGYVDDVRPHIARAAVYVVPIRVGGGTRLKILDAFACGKAVVSTSVGCEGLSVTPGKDILVGDSPKEFAHQTIKALTDQNLRQNLERNARKLVENEYSWSQIGRIQESIYQSLKR